MNLHPSKSNLSKLDNNSITLNLVDQSSSSGVLSGDKNHFPNDSNDFPNGIIVPPDKRITIKIKSKTKSYTSVLLRLNNREATAIIDTGSNVSFISRELAHQLGLSYVETRKQPTINGYGVSAVRMIGIVIDVKVTLNGLCEYVGDLNVVNSDQVPLLLGMDWLSAGKFTLDLENMWLIENIDSSRTNLLDIRCDLNYRANLFYYNMPIMKTVYLVPGEVTKQLLHFPNEVNYFRRKENSTLEIRIIKKIGKKKIWISILNRDEEREHQKNTFNKSQSIPLGLNGEYRFFGIRAYDSRKDFLEDSSYGPDITRVTKAHWSEKVVPHKEEINYPSLFDREKGRIVTKILQRNDTMFYDSPKPALVNIKYSRRELLKLKHTSKVKSEDIMGQGGAPFSYEGIENSEAIDESNTTKVSEEENTLSVDHCVFTDDCDASSKDLSIFKKISSCLKDEDDSTGYDGVVWEDACDFSNHSIPETSITLVTNKGNYEETKGLTHFENNHEDLLKESQEELEKCEDIGLHIGENKIEDSKKDGDILSKINFGTAATKEQLEIFKKLVKRFECIFISSKQMIPPPMKVQPIDIDVGKIKPISLQPRQVNSTILKKLQQKIQDGLKEGSIRHTTSPWAAPLVIVAKKNGDIRITADYREINKVVSPMKYSVPTVSEVIEKFDSCKIFSAMDCASGFTQIPLSKQASEVLAFTCPLGNFAITRLAQGYKNSPAIFQCAMNKAFSTHEKPYFDDFAVGASTFKDYYKKMKRIFNDCLISGVSLSAEKSFFCCENISLLGFNISSLGKTPEFKDKNSLLAFPEPKNVKEVLSFMGSLLYYRHSIPGFASRSAALYQMNELRFKTFNGLSPQATKSFNNLKEQLDNIKTLPFINDKQPFVLILYSNSWSVGVSLCQELQGRLKTVSYSGRVLNQSERQLNIVMIEALALLHAVKVYEAYLLYSETPFIVFTKYSALSRIMNTRSTHGIILNWSIKLSSFNFHTKKVSERLLKENTFYSIDIITPEELEKEVSNLEPIILVKPKLPLSCLSTIPLYSSCILLTFDGSFTAKSKISAHGFAAWRLPERQFIFGVASRNSGRSVNEAEYHAAIEGLRYVKEKQLTNVYILGDSQLIISQVRGSANVLKPELQELKKELDKLITSEIKEFYHIPRRLNATADFLSKLGKENETTIEYSEGQGDKCITQVESFWEGLEELQPKPGILSEEEPINCFVTTRRMNNSQGLLTDRSNTADAEHITEMTNESPGTTDASSETTN